MRKLWYRGLCLLDANRNKVGAPYRYREADHAGRGPDGGPACHVQAVGRHDIECWGKSTSVPITAPCTRINKLDVDAGGKAVTVKDKRMFMVVDATGLKQHNRGEWIRKKRGKKRGFAKVHPGYRD